MNLAQQDNEEFRDLVCRLLPGLTIDEIARPSGQRIVYFGTFAHADDSERESWNGHPVNEWGKIVVKVSSGITAEAITYLQREIHTLNGLESGFYPTLFYDEVFNQDPQTEEILSNRLFITIEEFILPLIQCFLFAPTNSTLQRSKIMANQKSDQTPSLRPTAMPRITASA